MPAIAEAPAPARAFRPSGPRANGHVTGLVTALIYTRVSTDEQARDGLSLDAQLADCRRYAAVLGWVLGTEYQDVLKGTRDDRPDYRRLLAEVRRLRAEGRRPRGAVWP